MKTRITLLALGALALLPFGLANTASAHDYDRDDRLERHIDRDRAAIHRDYAERNYYTAREHEALRHGNYWGAQWFSWRRRHEDREIAARRNDLRRDYSYEHRGY